MDKPRPSLKSDLAHAGRGLLMGGADAIPGVSGGTVALVLGIYDRLVTAISRGDSTLIGMLVGRRWREAADRIDLRFLVALAVGIATGILSLASMMKWLLANHEQATHAAFFGLVAGSSLVVARMLGRWTPAKAGMAISGALVAAAVVGLPLLKQPPTGNFYLFVSGLIAISAMILPGVSGAFLLVLLGKYEEVLDLLRDLTHGQASTETLVSLVVFCAGCLVGLLTVSKLIKRLLVRHPGETLATLCGVMIGSLRKLWPYQAEMPWGSSETLSTGLIIAGVVAVLLLERLGRRE